MYSPAIQIQYGEQEPNCHTGSDIKIRSLLDQRYRFCQWARHLYVMCSTRAQVSECVGHLDTTIMGTTALILLMGQLLRYSVFNECHSFKTARQPYRYSMLNESRSITTRHTIDTAIIRLTALMMSMGWTFGYSMLTGHCATSFFDSRVATGVNCLQQSQFSSDLHPNFRNVFNASKRSHSFHFCAISYAHCRGKHSNVGSKKWRC